MESIMSRTLSIHQEHELLLKLEAAGLDKGLASQIITSRDNELARNMIEFARNGNLLAAEAQPPAQPQLIALPAIGVEFDLTLDPATQGLALVTTFGYSGKWKFKGQPIAEPFTRRFKLEAVGACPNLDAVARECRKYGRVPEGPWLDSFRQVYPNNDGQGPIGVADPSWVDPDGLVDFPLLIQNGAGWNPDFRWVGNGRNALWRWLIEVRS